MSAAIDRQRSPLTDVSTMETTTFTSSSHAPSYQRSSPPHKHPTRPSLYHARRRVLCPVKHNLPPTLLSGLARDVVALHLARVARGGQTR